MTLTFLEFLLFCFCFFFMVPSTWSADQWRGGWRRPANGRSSISGVPLTDAQRRRRRPPSASSSLNYRPSFFIILSPPPLYLYYHRDRFLLDLIGFWFAFRVLFLFFLFFVFFGGKILICPRWFFTESFIFRLFAGRRRDATARNAPPDPSIALVRRPHRNRITPVNDDRLCRRIECLEFVVLFFFFFAFLFFFCASSGWRGLGLGWRVPQEGRDQSWATFCVLQGGRHPMRFFLASYK